MSMDFVNHINNDLDFADQERLVSPLSLYSEYQRLSLELRAPGEMSTSHWHGQVEVNIPFDGDIEYVINGEKIHLKQGHIIMFWACVPHRLSDKGGCENMAIFNLPMHLFLSWPISKELINHVTHGMVVQSRKPQQISLSEIQRWQSEINHANEQIRQISLDEMGLMIRRFGLSGWDPLLIHSTSKTRNNSVSKHSQFYVSQMLEYIAANHDSPLTVREIADHVSLNANYAMGLFQRVMQLTIKQYITAMRINHARVLLSESDQSILDVALISGFSSSSRFYDTFFKFVGMTPLKYRKSSRIAFQ